MSSTNLIAVVQDLVRDATQLKNRHTDQVQAPVNYAAVFSQRALDFDDLLSAANQLGRIVHDTPTGPLFHTPPIKTVSGDLILVKIRKPDPTRPERGDADFTIGDHPSFKDKYLSKPGFSLIQREKFEMIELMEPSSDVRAYFSYPPLDEQLGLR